MKKKRQEIHWSMLNAHRACRRPFCPLRSLYVATPASAATAESLVMDVRYTVLIHFPIIAQRSKRHALFSRVVGLVVNIRQCSSASLLLKL